MVAPASVCMSGIQLERLRRGRAAAAAAAAAQRMLNPHKKNTHTPHKITHTHTPQMHKAVWSVFDLLEQREEWRTTLQSRFGSASQRQETSEGDELKSSLWAVKKIWHHKRMDQVEKKTSSAAFIWEITHGDALTRFIKQKNTRCFLFPAS